MKRTLTFFRLSAAFWLLLGTAAIATAQPAYNVISLGQPGESASGGQGISNSGNFATGFTDSDPLIWSAVSGTTVLSDEASRSFSIPWSVNDAGTVVGIGAQTFFGAGPSP